LVSLSPLFTGFDANRDEGLAMLETCYREGGMLAPFAASTWAAYQLDAKTFLGERQTPDDFMRCRRMFRWARKRYAKTYYMGLFDWDIHTIHTILTLHFSH